MLRVRHYPYQSHSLMFGGFEVQMLSTINAIENYFKDKVIIEKNNPWNIDSNFDIAHFWGLGFPSYEDIKWARKSNKTVILTALFSYYESNMSKFKYLISSAIGPQKYYKELLNHIDTLVVVSEHQKKIAIKYFNFKPKNIFIIPNIVGDIFFDDTNIKRPRIIPFREYIVSIGNVCSRKNQHKLSEAILLNNQKLVILGNPVIGEEQYTKQFAEFVSENSDNLLWIKGLNANSSKLRNIIKYSSAVALPSYQETQPISLLEAAVLQKPIVVSNLAFAYQKYYQNSRLVNPNSIKSISNGLLDVIENSNRFIAPLENLKDCTSKNVASAYMDIYK